MRGLAVAFLAAFCGSLGSILWGRVMTDAPDRRWRFAFFWFWLAAGLMVAFTDPINGQVAVHPKGAGGIFLAWIILGIMIAQSKQFASPRLSMNFIKDKPPYHEPGIMKIGDVAYNAMFYRIGITSDKTALVSVSVNGVSLDGIERHDLSLHRMGDLTYKETVTEVSKARTRYWDILVYVKSGGFLGMDHLQENLPKELYPASQSFTVTATAPGTQEVSRTVRIEIDDAQNLLFTLT